MSSGGGTRAVLAAFAANLGIAVAKLVAFLITGASSLLAEAIHSFADSGNQGLLLFGGQRARRRPDAEHPFGYGRERYFWAFVVALVLFSVGGLFAIYEGIDKLRHPAHLESPVVAFTVLAVAIALEGLSLRTAVRETAHVKRAGQTYRQFIRNTRLPELPVVLLEDTAALTGLVLALAGLVLAETTGEARYDAVGTVAIGVLLVFVAVVLAREMKSLLIGES
ncbi:MAG TPA: cation diffusion facilitator family transporter, partial [Mycobacteriales bacterium]|nr:cation diffusion facilitator family transporter [Mycobacteriales bacterium]